MRRTIHPRTRGGFTLVELLVVMTIIGVLVALISSGVVAVIHRGNEVRARNEVTQLANAVQAFKTQFSIQFIPDRLTLPPGYDTTGATQVFLKSVWPRLDARTFGTTGTNQFTINGRQTHVFDYWQVQGNQAVTLQGDQVLVWMLGGWREIVPSTGDTIATFGFATDPTDPMKPYTAGAQRHTFFDGFMTERLRNYNASGRATNFPSFVDVYEKVPYIYFSSGKAGNDYTASPHTVPSIDPNSGAVFTKGVLPYKLSQNKYANPNSFQIICAGRDQLFGDGGLGWGGVANASLGVGVKDDIANFYQTKLGD
jgi:prepilin-type N-terminal cleavage/methylation domain-containing protein